MNKPADIRLTEEMLCEAIELLDGMRSRMGLFERQYFAGLKRRYEHHRSLNVTLRSALNDVDTEHTILE